jgi:hypothetical protein
MRVIDPSVAVVISPYHLLTGSNVILISSTIIEARRTHLSFVHWWAPHLLADGGLA